MIVKRVKIENWRAIRSQELHFREGLNVLRGVNERGKSTVVEAIHKALYWDHRQKKRKEDRLEHIVPGGNPTARPTVEVELEFGDTHVVVTKIVAEDKRDRRCVLRVRNGAALDETLRDAQAEERLAALLREAKSGPELGLSRQGQSYSCLSEVLPQNAVSALTIGRDGAVLPSQRLGSIRDRIRAERDKQLTSKLKDGKRLYQQTKAGTRAAELVAEGQKKRELLDEAGEMLALINGLRNRILGNERSLEALSAQVGPAKENLDRQRDQYRRQQEAGTTRLQRQAAANQLRQKLEALERRLTDINDLRRDIADASVQRHDADAELKRLEEQKKKASLNRLAAQDRRAQADGLLDDLRKRHEAHTAQRNAFQQQAALQSAADNLARLAEAQEQLSTSEQQLEALGDWPTGVKIGRWRTMFRDLDGLRRDAITRLQVRLDLSLPRRVEWSADGGPAASAEYGPGSSEPIGAVRALRLVIKDVGTVQINCGATELAELVGQIEAKTRELDGEIAVHGVTAGDLPDGFDRLEEMRIQGEDVERTAKDARAHVRALEKQLGGMKKLKETFAANQKQFAAAQAKLDVLRTLVPTGLDPEQLANEIDSLKSQVDRQCAEAEAARLALEGVTQVLNSIETSLGEQRGILSQLKAQLGGKNDQLKNLLADALGDDERVTQINESRVALAGAEREHQQAQVAVATLGPAISDIELAALEKNVEALREEIEVIKRSLAHDRGEVRSRCLNDPQGQIDQLTSDIKQLERELADEERKLGALLLLDAILAEEQRKLTLLIAAPLNQQVGPWLRQIRGLDTTIEFDPQTSRITNVVTGAGTRSIPLPFAELSEGTKGQISLLVRLTLAREIARQNGGRYFVILDDPLTETSPDRRPEMFRVLQQAARDVQILFVTCHADVLATLPGQPNVLELIESTQDRQQ
jgi:hypothetical protein